MDCWPDRHNGARTKETRTLQEKYFKLRHYPESSFLAIAPMDVHLSMFSKFHAELKGFTKKQLAITGRDELSIFMTNVKTGKNKTVILGFADQDGGLLAGVSIED